MSVSSSNPRKALWLHRTHMPAFLQPQPSTRQIPSPAVSYQPAWNTYPPAVFHAATSNALPRILRPVVSPQRLTVPFRRHQRHYQTCPRIRTKIAAAAYVSPAPRRRDAEDSYLSRFLRRASSQPAGPYAKDADVARLPSKDAPCACFSGMSYAKCCRRFHTDTATPAAAVDLLRARYSAYAYRLPAYIMRTTHRTTAEVDRVKWRSEIMEFAQEYRFCDGVEVIEQNMTSADTTTILFRANMRRRTTPVSFMELARFVRDNNQWFYIDGKLVDFDDVG